MRPNPWPWVIQDSGCSKCSLRVDKRLLTFWKCWIVWLLYCRWGKPVVPPVLFQQVVRKSFQESWGQGGVPSSLFQSIALSVFFQRASKTLVWAFGVIIFCANFLGLDGVWLWNLIIIKVAVAMLCVVWPCFHFITLYFDNPTPKTRKGIVTQLTQSVCSQPI